MDLLEEFKDYLRIDGEDEESSLLTFIQSAQTYLENAGVKQPTTYYLMINGKDVFAQHRLAIMMLATHYYENRLAYAIGNKGSASIPYGLESIILQLKWVNPDELSAQ